MQTSLALTHPPIDPVAHVRGLLGYDSLTPLHTWCTHFGLLTKRDPRRAAAYAMLLDEGRKLGRLLDGAIKAEEEFCEVKSSLEDLLCDWIRRAKQRRLTQRWHFDCCGLEFHLRGTGVREAWDRWLGRALGGGPIEGADLVTDLMYFTTGFDIANRACSILGTATASGKIEDIGPGRRLPTLVNDTTLADTFRRYRRIQA